MDTGSTSGQTEIVLKVNGSSAYATGRVPMLSPMETSTSASTTTEKLTAMGSTDGPTVTPIPASS
jgi:hypothetical protein